MQTYSLDIPVHSLGAEEALFYIAPESVVTLVFVLFTDGGVWAWGYTYASQLRLQSHQLRESPGPRSACTQFRRSF